MWQLLVTVKYLHSMCVWHRDLKSQVRECVDMWVNGSVGCNVVTSSAP